MLLGVLSIRILTSGPDIAGTGTWSVMEAARRHVSAPTIASAHFFRIASADRAERVQVVEALGRQMGDAKKQPVDESFRSEFLKELHLATYCGCLASFAQGLNLIARASQDEGWGVDLASCIQIWREGCIIRSEYIADVFEPVLEKEKGVMNVLSMRPVADEIRRTVPSLNMVISHALKWNAHVSVWIICLRIVKADMRFTDLR